MHRTAQGQPTASGEDHPNGDTVVSPPAGAAEVVLDGLTTEARNPASESLDQLSSLEIVQVMNAEDRRVAEAVGREAESIAVAVDHAAERLARGGRVIYTGAGTSGRLGVLDAAECPPTFGTEPWQVVGVIAGGSEALTRAIEGAEDNPELGGEDLRKLAVGEGDMVVGIATSGRTPYVIGALKYAKSAGCYCVALSCNENSEVQRHADLAITPIVGPEVLSGSTRLKAGTATKLVLNTITTGAMVRLGKTFGNLMIDVRPTNAKLWSRATRIVSEATDLPPEQASELLTRCGGDVKVAIVSHLAQSPFDEARRRLSEAQGRVSAAFNRQVEL